MKLARGMAISLFTNRLLSNLITSIKLHAEVNQLQFLQYYPSTHAH